MIVLVASFLCSTYLLQLALIQGESMAPAYHHMQIVLVSKLSQNYSRGDVVVFRKDDIGGLLIKRVAAVPGDEVQISKGRLFVNGKTVENLELIDEAGRAETMIVLGEDQYFVLGDNVNQSIDSRSGKIGDISQTQILGRVIFP